MLSYSPTKFYGPTEYQVVKIHNNDPPSLGLHPAEVHQQAAGHVLGERAEVPALGVGLTAMADDACCCS